MRDKLVFWLFPMLGFFALTLVAICARLSSYYYVPHVLGRILDWFTNPGEAIWWLAMGGPFANYPATGAGYMVFILGNVVSWTVISALSVRVVKWIFNIWVRQHRP